MYVHDQEQNSSFKANKKAGKIPLLLIIDVSQAY